MINPTDNWSFIPRDPVSFSDGAVRLHSEMKCLGELREPLMHLPRTRRLLLCYAGADGQESDAKKESKVGQGEPGPGLSRAGQHLFSQVFLFLLELRDLFLYCSLANKPEKQIDKQQSETQSRISTNTFKLHASLLLKFYIFTFGFWATYGGSWGLFPALWLRAAPSSA